MESDPEGQHAPESEKKSSPRRAAKPTLDLDAAHRTLKFESREHPDELTARLKRQDKEDDHVRRKELIVLAFVTIFLTAIATSCLVVAWQPGSSEDKKWAMAVLASIVSVATGYILPRPTKPGSI